LNVLIVDDSAAIRKILQRVLRQAEIPIGEVYEAGDGAEAL
jgi:two-component system chemotaxis response regulator CheY